MRKVLRKAKRRGWTILHRDKHSSSHYVLEWTDGTRIIASVTPSDYRGAKNFLADMRRVERNAP